MFSKPTSAFKIQVLKIFIVKLLDSFFNIRLKRCYSLKRTSLVVFLLVKSDGSVFFIKVHEASSKKPKWSEGWLKNDARMAKQTLLH